MSRVGALMMWAGGMSELVSRVSRAALLERPEFESHTEAVIRQERLAIRTTRSIAAHTGYRSVNDDLFWRAVTQRVPAILDRLR